MDSSESAIIKKMQIDLIEKCAKTIEELPLKKVGGVWEDYEEGREEARKLFAEVIRSLKRDITDRWTAYVS